MNYVRDAKGKKDRITVFPESIKEDISLVLSPLDELQDQFKTD